MLHRLVARGGVGLAASLLATSVAVAGDPGVYADKIVFGQVAALSGPAAELGIEMRTGLQAAFAEVNRVGGIAGRRLELVSVDDGYDPKTSIEVTSKLLSEGKVFGLVGAVGTPTSAATQPMAQKEGIPFIGPFTGAQFLRDRKKSNVINVRASYFQETEEMVERLTKDLGIRRIAIFYQDDAFGRAGLAGVQNALTKRNMELVSEGVFERNTVAVKRALLSIEKGKPEAVVMVGPYQPCAEFIKIARQTNLNAVLVNISFVGSVALAKAVGPAGAGVAITQVVPFPTDAAHPLVARYQAALKASQFNAAPAFGSLEGYMVGRLVIAALGKISAEPTRKDLLDAILGNTFDLDGVSLTYSADNNQGMNTVYLTTINADGSLKPIDSFSRLGTTRFPSVEPPARAPEVGAAGSIITAAEASSRPSVAEGLRKPNRSAQRRKRSAAISGS